MTPPPPDAAPFLTNVPSQKNDTQKERQGNGEYLPFILRQRRLLRRTKPRQRARKVYANALWRVPEAKFAPAAGYQVFPGPALRAPPIFPLPAQKKKRAVIIAWRHEERARAAQGENSPVGIMPPYSAAGRRQSRQESAGTEARVQCSGNKQRIGCKYLCLHMNCFKFGLHDQ